MFTFYSIPAFLGDTNKMQYIPVIKGDLDAVDYLTKLGRGRTSVKTSDDWYVIGKIFEFWTRKWPHEWREFGKTIKDIRATRRSKTGKSASGEIKYVGALPPRFMRLIKIMFPYQQFNKEFVYKLVKNIKIVKVGERNDTWFLV